MGQVCVSTVKIIIDNFYTLTNSGKLNNEKLIIN